MTAEEQDQIAGLRVEVTYLRTELKELKDLLTSSHKGLAERLSNIELWRARLAGAFLGVPTVVAIVSGVVTALLTAYFQNKTGVSPTTPVPQ